MYILEGNISVKAAILSSYRSVDKVVVDKQKKDKDTNYILHRAKDNNIPIEYTSREEIDELASGNTHGGLLAFVGERQYQTLDDIKEPSFIACVEGIEDPFNFGYILRSLYACGCEAIITSSRNWSTAASTLAKASAGASEYIPMIVSDDFAKTMQSLKQKDIKVVCANRNDSALPLTNFDFTQAICICIGGEKRGLSKDIANQSDQDVYIPYHNDFRNALSASSATTILAYEIMRQRM